MDFLGWLAGWFGLFVGFFAVFQTHISSDDSRMPLLLLTFPSLLIASGLRTPMAVPCPYPTPFGIVPHAGMNGELTSPGAAYAGLHNISPQMSAAAAAAAAAAAYGRSPVVSVCRWCF